MDHVTVMSFAKYTLCSVLPPPYCGCVHCERDKIRCMLTAALVTTKKPVNIRRRLTSCMLT